MGSRLTALTGLILAGALLTDASPAGAQNDPGEAAALFDEGLDAYRKKNYPRAIELLKRSYEIEATIDALYAWAQAERLSGDCDEAVRLYRRILNESPNFKHAAIVQDNLELCAEEAEPEGEEAADPDQVAAPAGAIGAPRDRRPAPPRDQGGRGGIDLVAVSLLSGGALGLGAAAGLYVASNASRDGAAGARSYDEYLDLRDRADLQRGLSIGAAATGAALIGLGVYRWVTASDGERRSSGVSAAAGSGSAVVRFTVRW